MTQPEAPADHMTQSEESLAATTPPDPLCVFARDPADQLVRSATFVAASAPASEEPVESTPFDELGYLLLGQTRLRPAGAVVGDLQFTLGLAPRERVVLTQKAWTKRNVSLEEVIGETEEVSIEYSSSFSTELSENTEHEQQEQSSRNISASVSGGYGPVSASVGLASTASQAQTTTAQSTSKQAREETRRTANTARREHRITFSVETETGIENLSQRTIENPNTCHSLMLNVYRVHQKLKAARELWGLRACWAPCVKDPGRDVRTTPGQVPGLTEADKVYLAEVANWIPPDMSPPEVETIYSAYSELVESNVAGYSDDVKTTIEIPAERVLLNLEAERHPEHDFGGSLGVPQKSGHGQPVPGATGTRDVWWHVGLAQCWPNNCPEPRAMIRTKFTVGPDSGAVAKYAEELKKRRAAEYERRLKVIQDRLAAEITPGARGGYYDPWSELMRRVITERVSAISYDTCDEVVQWHDTFEWENATFDLYPHWWGGSPTAGAQSRRPTFLNASWARLYIPVREGSEEQAFLLIFGTKGAGAELKAFAADLRTYRTSTFGTPGAEKVVQLAQWEELMPTDGTFMESVVGRCQACDAESLALMKAERELIEAQAKALSKPPK